MVAGPSPRRVGRAAPSTAGSADRAAAVAERVAADAAVAASRAAEAARRRRVGWWRAAVRCRVVIPAAARIAEVDGSRPLGALDPGMVAEAARVARYAGWVRGSGVAVTIGRTAGPRGRLLLRVGSQRVRAAHSRPGGATASAAWGQGPDQASVWAARSPILPDLSNQVLSAMRRRGRSLQSPSLSDDAYVGHPQVSTTAGLHLGIRRPGCAAPGQQTPLAPLDARPEASSATRPAGERRRPCWGGTEIWCTGRVISAVRLFAAKVCVVGRSGTPPGRERIAGIARRIGCLPRLVWTRTVSPGPPAGTPLRMKAKDEEMHVRRRRAR